MRRIEARLLSERVAEGDIATAKAANGRTVRSVPVNIAESPLGWLFSRGHVS